MSFDVQIDADEVLQELDRIKVALEDINPVIGEAAKLRLMDHLTDKNASSTSHKTATRLGANPSQLYAEFVKAITYDENSDQVVVSINHNAARQRYFGGDIYPVNKTYLTIPITAESYGKTIDDFAHTDSLKWFFGKNRKPYAVGRASEPTRKLFILTTHVHQDGDKTILPDDDTWAGSILETVLNALDLGDD